MTNQKKKSTSKKSLKCIKTGGAIQSPSTTWVDMKTFDSKAPSGHQTKIINGICTGMCRNSNSKPYDCPDLKHRKA